MKGYYFYLEYPTNKDKRAGTRKNPGNHSGTVLAVYTDPEYSWSNGKDITTECIGVVQDIPNSDVCTSACSWGYLRENCKRISEAQARTIHPKLFQYLEQ